jgi:hypothetical protein
MKYLKLFHEIFEGAKKKYTDAELEEIAKKYKTLYDFRKYDKNIYNIVTNRGEELLNKITSNMDRFSN